MSIPVDFEFPFSTTTITIVKMHFTQGIVAGISLAAGLVSASPCGIGGVSPIKRIDLGPRPFFLVDDMDDGPLKRKLNSCKDKEMKTSDFSLGHRGG